MKGKIVLVAFPFDDLTAAKLRPAVCLTNVISSHNHVILAFITSHIPEEKLESDIVINYSDQDFSVTGLRVSSTIRLHRLMTISTSLIQRELGMLSIPLQNMVDEKLKNLFGL
ncbi:type II toxin-antitoxin system PemK/MazF family toxin [candidate division KSB1 bacterium]|nr:type II toxin-antitoxin system PemK/MazF family toxin [candidate division KSB1 bacterium]